MASDITNDGNDFEIIFVSSDRSANDYKGYFADMPWKSLDFNNPKFQMYSSSLKQKYDNQGIPQFAIVRGSDGNLLTKNARGGVSSDPEGKDFPWPRKAMYTLQEDLEGIDSSKSIVLMMDKGTDADKDEIYQFMSSHAKAQQALKEEREFFHFAAMVADTRAAPKIREFTSLGEESAMICLDPVNKEPLSEEQLIEIKCSPLVKPKPPSATSIPAILKSLQDEWDAVMLHSFTLRQQLQTARQELSHALYQHDAACRVIARLNKEVTAAREALATLKPQAAPMMGVQQVASQGQEAGQGAGDSQEVTGITEEIVEKLQEKATVLTQER